MTAINSRWRPAASESLAFQFDRVHRFADPLAVTPTGLADRVVTLVASPIQEAVVMLYAVDDEVLSPVVEHGPPDGS